MTERLKTIVANITTFVVEKPWVFAKFCMLFTAVAGFVSYNFGGMIVGLPIAITVTALAVANWKIFDAASDAFLDVQVDDGVAEMAKKTIAATIKRLFYSAIDYGETALSIALVVAMREVEFQHLKAIAGSWLSINLPAMIMGIDVRFVIALVAMWLVLDLLPALASIALYQGKGVDITLGRSYRRMANVIYAHSKMTGVVVFLHEITLASFWSGPDYTVLFFWDELKTWTKLIVAAVIITTVHAILWTTVYWIGYENIIESVNYLLGR